ncbi:MAG: hypothetical protein Q4C47_03700 [Planctomycetia bacterium]|nr:hypothetical protein [Planctomycetia bacterium]
MDGTLVGNRKLSGTPVRNQISENFFVRLNMTTGKIFRGTTTLGFVSGLVLAPLILIPAFCEGIGNSAVTPESPIVRFDFEDGSSQGFSVVEGSFGRWIGSREREYHNETVPYSKQGGYYLTTLDNGDGTVPDDRYTGVIESPVFVVSDDHGNGVRASMLVGGGGASRNAEEYVALVTDDDGQEVLYARGDDSQKFLRREWDLTPYAGKAVYLRIVDRGTDGWCHLTFDDFQCPGVVSPERTVQRDRNRFRRRFLAGIQPRIDSLRRAISALEERYGGTDASGYPAAELRAQLDALIADLPDGKRLVGGMGEMDLPDEETGSDPGDLAVREEEKKSVVWMERFTALRREALVTRNPLLNAHPILYVNRAQYLEDHHNTATIFQTGEINTGSFRGGMSLKSWNPATGEVRVIYTLEEGGIRDPDVSFDGTKILFSARRNRDDDWHLYEISAEATPESPVGLRQITSGVGVSDIDPIYLPDGDLLFASTRDPKYCMCNRHIMCNLYRCGADGTGIYQITWNTLFDGHPTLLEDGRIIYDRWEYVDRNFGSAQGTWTINPDGTQPVVHYGNSTYSPGGVLDSRPIPGTGKVVSTFSSCHDLPWGAIAIVDRQKGVENRPGVERTWPEDAIRLVDAGDYDTFKRVNPRYEDPYPLSEDFFLCSRMVDRDRWDRTAIFLIDTYGNDFLVHADEPGCFDPMPLAPRKKPPVIVSRTDPTRTTGEFFVQDIYRGETMRGVERGRVKSLRIVASPEKRYWCSPGWNSGTGEQAPGMAWDDYNNKAIVGTVPVEPDGSAYFSVPAGLFVYFQALDEDGRMVQTMRSGTTVQPGERTGCIGCHENRRSSVPVGTPGIASSDGPDVSGDRSGSEGSGGIGSVPLAVQRAPDTPELWYGPMRNFGYRQEVQPVWDRYCVSCHDYGQPAGEVLNLAGDATMIFNTSYIELRRKSDAGVKVVGAGPAEVLSADLWGANHSPVARVILHGHRDPSNDLVDGVRREMDPESVDRVMTWIDLNAPYYPEYATGFPDHPFGRSPITDDESRRLSELTGLDPRRMENLTAYSFSRPEISPALSRIPADPPQLREEALQILERGKQRFAQTPGADMVGFRLTRPEEIWRREKMERLREADRAARVGLKPDA